MADIIFQGEVLYGNVDRSGSNRTVLFIKLVYVAAVIVIGGRCAGIDL